jgi:hypothetical protein
MTTVTSRFVASSTAPVNGTDPGRMPLVRWLTTTPGRLRMLSVAGAAVIVVMLVAGVGALSARRGAADAVAGASGPRLVASERLYRALADADATASSALLRAGLEPSSVRARYLEDVDEVGRLLAVLAEQSGSRREVAAVETIAQQLPRYAGSVEAARSNIRLGFPLGAEHMRQASALMQDELLPAAELLYASAAAQLHSDYDRGTSPTQLALVAILGGIALVVLVGTLVYAARRTNRVLNVGVLAAVVIVLVIVVWTAVRLTGEQSSLVTAQRDGSDAVEVFSSARILALQAQANANLELAERGTGVLYHDAFADTIMRLGGAACSQGDECDGALLREARSIAARSADTEQVDEIAALTRSYVAQYAATRELDDAGEYATAVTAALGPQSDSAEQLDAAIDSAIIDAQRRFDAAAQEAASGFALLTVAFVIGLVLAVGLVLRGLQPRIQEYQR